MEKSRIRDQGSGINIPDPQHCARVDYIPQSGTKNSASGIAKAHYHRKLRSREPEAKVVITLSNERHSLGGVVKTIYNGNGNQKVKNSKTYLGPLSLPAIPSSW
jgi:hypothetical protein